MAAKNKETLPRQCQVDIKKCLVVKFVDGEESENDNEKDEVTVAYDAWLDKESVKDVEAIIVSGEVVTIDWPANTVIYSTATFINKKLPKCTFVQRPVVVMKAGEWSVCAKAVKNYRATGNMHSEKSKRKRPSTKSAPTAEENPKKKPKIKDKSNEWSDEKLEEAMKLQEKIDNERKKENFVFNFEDIDESDEDEYNDASGSTKKVLSNSASKSNDTDFIDEDRTNSKISSPKNGHEPHGSSAFDVSSTLQDSDCTIDKITNHDHNIKYVTRELLSNDDIRSPSSRANLEFGKSRDSQLLLLSRQETEEMSLQERYDCLLKEKNIQIKSLKETNCLYEKKLEQRDSQIAQLMEGIAKLRTTLRERDTEIQYLRQAKNSGNVALETLWRIKELTDTVVNNVTKPPLPKPVPLDTERNHDNLNQNSLMDRADSNVSNMACNPSHDRKKIPKMKVKQEKVNHGEIKLLPTDYELTDQNLAGVPQDSRICIRKFCNALLANLFTPKEFASSSPTGTPFKGNEQVNDDNVDEAINESVKKSVRPRLDEARFNAALNLCHKIYWKDHGLACRKEMISCARYKCTGARRKPTLISENV